MKKTVLVFLPLLLLLFLILWLKSLQVVGETVSYTLIFPRTGGLQVGAPVSVNGVAAGTVSEIFLHGAAVAVGITVSSGISFTDSSLVEVSSIGLMSGRQVEITLSPKGRLYTPDCDTVSNYIPGYYRPGLSESIGVFGSLLSRIDSTIVTEKTKASAESFYLTVENRHPAHPSMRDMPDSLRLYSVFDQQNRRDVPLDSIVDRQTFRQINKRGDYFADSANVYVYPSVMGHTPLFSIPLEEVTFAGIEMDYLLYRNSVYYRGVQLEHIRADEASFFQVLGDQKTLYEFITNGTILMDGDLVIDEERIQSYNLPKQYRDSILTGFRLK